MQGRRTPRRTRPCESGIGGDYARLIPASWAEADPTAVDPRMRRDTSGGQQSRCQMARAAAIGPACPTRTVPDEMAEKFGKIKLSGVCRRDDLSDGSAADGWCRGGSEATLPGSPPRPSVRRPSTRCSTADTISLNPCALGVIVRLVGPPPPSSLEGRSRYREYQRPHLP